MFLRALSFANLKDTINLKKELQSIISLASEEKIGKQAQYLLASINDPSKMNKANEIAISGYDYLFKNSFTYNKYRCFCLSIIYSYFKKLGTIYHGSIIYGVFNFICNYFINKWIFDR